MKALNYYRQTYKINLFNCSRREVYDPWVWKNFILHVINCILQKH
jgi:hypothetical protein